MIRILVLCAFLFGPLLAVAAPKKDRPAPSPDVVTGELRTSLDSPIVVLRQPDGSFEEHWLVFASNPGAEQFARGLIPGTMVKVTGVLGAGGRYRYVVVHAIAVAE